jgi:hypothetical protein
VGLTLGDEGSDEGIFEGQHVNYLVGKSALVNALLAGFVATYIATISGIWFYGVKLPVFNFPQLNGYIVLGLNANPTDVIVVGWVLQMVQGMLFALIFGLVLSPMWGRMFKALAPMTPIVNYTKGVIFGFLLYIISATLWVPLLIGPLLAVYNVPVGGFLSTFGPYGYQANFTDLFWHMIYGVNLGLLFSPSLVSGKRSASTPAATASGAE